MGIAAAVLLALAAASAAQDTPAGAASQPAAESQPTSASQPATVASGTMRLPDPSEENKSLNGLLKNDDGNQFSKMLSQVLVIAALGLIAFFIIKKVLPRMSVPAGMSRKNIKVLETTYLGPRKSLHLVQVGAKTFLVGSAGDQMTLMTEVEAPAPAEAPADKEEAPK